MAKSAKGKKSAQSTSLSLALASMGFSIPWNRSTIPLDWGLYGEVAIRSIPSLSYRPFISLLKKTLPLSDNTLRGIPVREIMSKKHWDASVAEAVLISCASGHLLARQIYVKRYLTPLLPLGKGPTKSTATVSKGTVTIPLSTILSF